MAQTDNDQMPLNTSLIPAASAARAKMTVKDDNADSPANQVPYELAFHLGEEGGIQTIAKTGGQGESQTSREEHSFMLGSKHGSGLIHWDSNHLYIGLK